MRWSASVAAMAVSAVLSFSAAALAADAKDRPFGGPPPQRSTDERPFGGPPPSDRVIKFKKSGKKCTTAAGACELMKARAVGTVCTCPEGDSNGAQGKVE